LEDLKQFVIILAVFIISYGVALQATLYPNTMSFWDVLKGIIEKPYFQMYGELFYEDFAGIHLFKPPFAFLIFKTEPDKSVAYVVASTIMVSVETSSQSPRSL
jgi:hypothetical protein